MSEKWEMFGTPDWLWWLPGGAIVVALGVEHGLYSSGSPEAPDCI